VKAGATVVGSPPVKSPSLAGHPACDEKVQKLAKDLWGSLEASKTLTKRSYGKGIIHWGGELSSKNAPLYPAYDLTAALLKGMGVVEDFTATGPVRYGHRRTNDSEIYFVSNRSGNPVKAGCQFRVGQGRPQLWDAVTGEIRDLPEFEQKDGVTSVPLEFDAFQSFFVVFRNRSQKTEVRSQNGEKNFRQLKQVQELSGSWDVKFDRKWGGPEGRVISDQSSVISNQESVVSRGGEVAFDKLISWTERPEDGIRYYSGTAVYRKEFSYQSSVISRQSAQVRSQNPEVSKSNTDHRILNTVFLSLGAVHDMARVKLNGKDLGVVWCAPWQVDISSAVKEGKNDLEIEVVNLWPNRLIGDLALPEDKRFAWTFVAHGHKADSKLLPSGLLGPVRLLTSEL
jgi:hypothetical protein